MNSYESELLKPIYTLDTESSNQVVYVQDLVEEVTRSTSLVAIYENIKLEVMANISADLQVECIPSQINKIISNLILNSIYAVSKNADNWIKLHVNAVAGHVYFSVVDSGNGLCPDSMSKLLFPFLGTGAPSSGFGYYLSRKIAESHGGKLEYIKGCKNTVFCLRLPII